MCTFVPPPTKNENRSTDRWMITMITAAGESLGQRTQVSISMWRALRQHSPAPPPSPKMPAPAHQTRDMPANLSIHRRRGSGKSRCARRDTSFIANLSALMSQSVVTLLICNWVTCKWIYLNRNWGQIYLFVIKSVNVETRVSRLQLFKKKPSDNWIDYDPIRYKARIFLVICAANK